MGLMLEAGRVDRIPCSRMEGKVWQPALPFLTLQKPCRGVRRPHNSGILPVSTHDTMDIQTIDQLYQQLQTQDQTIAQELQVLAGKLQAAAQGGSTDAREWLLDLREVALAVQAQQQQMNQLLQAIHAMWQNEQNQLSQPQSMPVAAQPGYMTQGMGQNAMAPAYGRAAGGGGLMGALGGFLNSGFGQAMEMGAGIGLGEDLINKIF